MTDHEIEVLLKEREILLQMAETARNFAKLDQELARGHDVFKERDKAKADLIDTFSGRPFAPVISEHGLEDYIQYLAVSALERKAKPNQKVAA